MSIPRHLPDQVADLYRRIAEMERRGQNQKRTGTVVEANYEKGLYRVQLKEKGSNGKPYITGWLPLKEMAAGEIKMYVPLSVGEQVTVKSENGDLSDAEIEHSINSKDNAKPHNKGGEVVLTIGSTRLHITKDLTEIRADHIVFKAQKIDHIKG